MKTINNVKYLIAAGLILLMVSAFQIRLTNFQNSKTPSIDEIVYFTMAKQVYSDISDYNTVPYGKELAATGRELPPYFFQPLFKHPPVFTYSLLASLKMFGPTPESAIYVTILFGVLMIPLVYLLGAWIFSRTVGCVAAFLSWLDPVTMICSQKVWMATTIGFFSLLSICFFVYAIKKEKYNFLILSGLACGLATATKYTGILPIIIMFIYALSQQLELFRLKRFWLGLVMPFICLLPWFYWNAKVFGLSFASFEQQQPYFAGFLKMLITPVGITVEIGIGIICWVLLQKFLKKRQMCVCEENKNVYEKEELQNAEGLSFQEKLSVTIIIVLVFGIIKQLYMSLTPFEFPLTSWGNFGFRYDTTPFFYFQQLTMLSFFYVFGFYALFSYDKGDKRSFTVLRYSAIVILAFFLIWRNYQTRYIIQAIPFLLVLASYQIVDLYLKIRTIKKTSFRVMFSSLFLLFLCYIVGKTWLVNLNVSYPHSFCFF